MDSRSKHDLFEENKRQRRHIVDQRKQTKVSLEEICSVNEQILKLLHADVRCHRMAIENNIPTLTMNYAILQTHMIHFVVSALSNLSKHNENEKKKLQKR